MTVKCPKCRKKSDLCELVDDLFEDENGYETYCNVVCPKCGFWLGEEDEVDEKYLIVELEE